MADKIAKIKFTAETEQFNDSIKKSNSEIKQMKAELNLASKQMSRTGESTEGLENQQKLLQKQLSASESKTEALNQKLAKAIKFFGEDSQEVASLRTQLTNAKTQQENFKIAIDSCNKKLEDQRQKEANLSSETDKLTRKIDDQQSELNSLKSDYVEAALKYGDTSDEAKELERSISDLSRELKQSKSALSDASKRADELDQSISQADESASNASGGFTVMKGAVADLASEAIQWGIEKISEFKEYLSGLPEATREFRQDMSTLNTSFTENGKTVKTAEGTWKELYAVFGEDDRAVETANNISKVADNQKDLNKWVDITTGVWGTYQDALPVENLAEAAMETSRTGTVTGGLADALNWSSEASKMFAKYIVEGETAEDGFNKALAECSGEQERQQLITDTLNTLYGDAADTYRDSAGAQMDAKRATAEHMQAEADLAETIEPVTTEVTNLKTQFLEGLQPAIEKVTGVALDALDWMQEHPTAMKAIGAAVGTLAIGLGGLAIAAGIYTAAQWAMNSAILANPITWIAVGIVAAIAAIVGIGVVLYQNWDKIKKKCSEMWSHVKGKFSDLKNSVVGKVTELKDKAVQKFDDFKKNTIKKASETKDKVSTHWNNLKNKTSTAFSNMKDKATQKYSDLKTKVVSYASNTKSKVSTHWDNLKNKTSSSFSGAKDKAVSQFASMKSKVVNYASSIYTGVRDKFNNIKNTISEKINSAKESVTNAVGKIKSAFNFSWKIPKPSIPKFSVSGGKAPWGFGGKGSLPNISVKWNKDGFIVNKASIIGQLGGTLMGAGEVEPEALTPISLLQDYINRAFERNINNYAIAGGGSDVYNFYVNDAIINDDVEMKKVAREFLEKIVRLGGMNR